MRTKIALKTTKAGTAVYLTIFTRTATGWDTYETQISPNVAQLSAARQMLIRAERLFDAGCTGSEIFRKLS